MTYREYPFPHNPMDTGYCVFPPELEDEEGILFHATTLENFELIKINGFRIPNTVDENALASVSFAKRSSGSLHHAIMQRDINPDNYCIIAVKYETLIQPSIKIEASFVYDYKMDPAPKIIGYCIIPQCYDHI